jgi:hypothetical protein
MLNAAANSIARQLLVLTLSSRVLIQLIHCHFDSTWFLNKVSAILWDARALQLLTLQEAWIVFSLSVFAAFVICLWLFPIPQASA